MVSECLKNLDTLRRNDGLANPRVNCFISSMVAYMELLHLGASTNQKRKDKVIAVIIVGIILLVLLVLWVLIPYMGGGK